MTKIDSIIKELRMLTPYALKEVADYIGYGKHKYKIKDVPIKVSTTSLVSEKSLAKDWLRPEEEEAWKEL